MDNKTLFYFVAFLSGTCGALADSFLNTWAKSKEGGQWLSLLVGYLFWNVGLLLFLYTLRHGMLAQVAFLFLVSNSAVVLVLSQFYFHEPLSTQKWVGIAIAFIGIVIMERG